MNTKNEIDLFQQPHKIPKKISKIFDRYWKRYEGYMDYKDTANMLKEVELKGYTFDYGLDNEPFGLQRMGKSNRTSQTIKSN